VNANSHRALFLDRDGVINHDAGYTSRVEDFHFIDGIFDLCRAARQAGYLLIVITNQAGIGRGYYSEDDFLVLTKWMRQRFEAEGATLTDVLYCPFHPEHGIGDYKKDSLDRKPNPGMLLRAAKMHSIDMKHSIMIGDKDSDMQAASAAGVAVRCQYLANADIAVLSNNATNKIDSLQEGLTLLENLRL
jgi:D-glycero-D-manno-heptose 1,7-bisphosphate phosphatase